MATKAIGEDDARGRTLPPIASSCCCQTDGSSWTLGLWDAEVGVATTFARAGYAFVAGSVALRRHGSGQWQRTVLGRHLFEAF